MLVYDYEPFDNLHQKDKYIVSNYYSASLSRTSALGLFVMVNEFGSPARRQHWHTDSKVPQTQKDLHFMLFKIVLVYMSPGIESRMKNYI